MDCQELKLLEDDLWDAVDQFHANSKLTVSEYSMPVLGLIFLRHATTRFKALLPDVEKAAPAHATGALKEDRIKLGVQGKAAIYLPETARYDYLAALPSGVPDDYSSEDIEARAEVISQYVQHQMQSAPVH